MIATIKNYLTDFSHLLFPHQCLGCAAEIKKYTDLLCFKCNASLPETNFSSLENNPVEQTFIARINIARATSVFYFTKESLLQHLLIQLKYKQHPSVGIFLGKKLGNALVNSLRFNNIDCMIPLPLSKEKLKSRGYNQAELICKGIQEKWNIPIQENLVIRGIDTHSQTKENRVNRWQNMKGVFFVPHPATLLNKNILLVDDVITTGATLEACGQAILDAGAASISIATVAWTI